MFRAWMATPTLTHILATAALMLGLWRLIARDIDTLRDDLRDVRADVGNLRDAWRASKDCSRGSPGNAGPTCARTPPPDSPAPAASSRPRLKATRRFTSTGRGSA